MSFQAGASIQRAKALFLRTLKSEWLQTELCLNMSRVWREQFEKLCLQVGFCLLDTAAWNTSLQKAGSLHLEDSLEAKRKRLTQVSQELHSTLKNESHEAKQSALVVNRLCSLDSITGGLELSNREFGDEEPGIRHHHRVSSFGSLDDILAGPDYSSMQSKTGSGLFDDEAQDSTEWTGVFYQEIPQDSKPRSEQMDGGIDSVVKKAFKEGEPNDTFLLKISSFLASTDFNFQHCDVWAPTQSTVSGGDMYGYGQMRLVNAGHITLKSSKIPSHTAEKLNEFGVYSKTISFAPGSGLPGRVFATGQSIWMNDVHQATAEEFGLAGGARMYGIRTAVGLHVPTSIATLVVVFYSTADLPRDVTVENHCMNFFRQLNPTPKWHLSIEVADNETEGVVSPSPETTGCGKL